jgi:hypothetical protein
MNLDKLKAEHKAGIATAIATVAMSPVMVHAEPLDDLVTASSSMGGLVTAIGGAAVAATAISAGVALFRRATGR